MATPEPLRTIDGMDDALERVEKALRASVTSDDPFLTEVAGHLIGAGGKRIRPSLAVAAAAACGADISDDVIQGAISVELVHLGSLYHDDVMDEAETRRSVESVNARWGNLVAILAGDFLLARASELASELGTEVAGLLAATISELCVGQVTELQHVYDVSRTEESYLRAIAGKTAALTATSCRIGALVAETDRETIDALTDYGQAFGMVFQIVDDILDVVATAELLGKPAGNDLVEGVYTLPVITTMAGDGGETLRAMLGSPLEPEVADRARGLVRSNGSVAEATDRARAYADDAVKALRVVPASAAAESLAALPHHIIDRIPL